MTSFLSIRTLFFVFLDTGFATEVQSTGNANIAEKEIFINSDRKKRLSSQRVSLLFYYYIILFHIICSTSMLN